MGQVDCTAQFERIQGNKLATHLHFAPSKIRIDTIALQVQPSELTYTHNNLDIKHFELSNKEQHIIVNGQTSGNASDSLTVQLKDIDVPYILDIVNFHSVSFGGFASAKWCLSRYLITLAHTPTLLLESLSSRKPIWERCMHKLITPIAKDE